MRQLVQSIHPRGVLGKCMKCNVLWFLFIYFFAQKMQNLSLFPVYFLSTVTISSYGSFYMPWNGMHSSLVVLYVNNNNIIIINWHLKNAQLTKIVTQTPVTTRKPSLRTEQKSLDWTFEAVQRHRWVTQLRWQSVPSVRSGWGKCLGTKCNCILGQLDLSN